MEVETKNASLDTMAVTIQALHVNGKQMTLAVFRQLPIGSLVLDSGDADERLRWWGVVRYKVADEGEVWVVADAGGKLYRAPVRQPRPASAARIAAEFEDKLARGAYAWQYINFRRFKTRDDAERASVEARQEWEYAQRVAPVFERAELLPQLFIAV